MLLSVYATHAVQNELLLLLLVHLVRVGDRVGTRARVRAWARVRVRVRVKVRVRVRVRARARARGRVRDRVRDRVRATTRVLLLLVHQCRMRLRVGWRPSRFPRDTLQ